MYEGEIEKICNNKMTLETQVMDLESATGNKQAFMAMKIGTGAMKSIRQEMEIENVDEMMKIATGAMKSIRQEMEIENVDEMMKIGTGSMKSIRQEMEIEKVDDMMYDILKERKMEGILEEMEMVNEISNAIC